MVQRECRTSVGKTKSVLLAQVKETGNRRAELKEENGARMRGGVEKSIEQQGIRAGS